jgi:sugar phosphate isomerase/epimerase
LGAGGIQIPFGIRDTAYIKSFRAAAEESNLFFEAIINAPKTSADLDPFVKRVTSAKEAGAQVIRTVIMPGRRYEQFPALDEFRQAEKQALKSVNLMAPIVEKHKMSLAIENHKDHRVEERLQILEQFSSEYIGVCFDVGNSFALLEDPVEVAKAFAPWTFSVHLKDQAVKEYGEGFLFADAALGEGILDLNTIVKVLQKANPPLHYSLETITRDPLKVPCLTEQYWRTMQHVSGIDLARTLRVVKTHSAEAMKPISHLPIKEQVEIERTNVIKSLAYSKKELGL